MQNKIKTYKSNVEHRLINYASTTRENRDFEQLGTSFYPNGTADYV